MNKNSFVGVVGLCVVSSSAMAQSSVELYGSVDAGVSRVSGLAGGTKNFLVSGVMDGSRVGFRGREDLGSGYRAFFTLENRLEVDTGAITVRPLSGVALPDRLANAQLLGITPAALGLPATPSVTGALNAVVGSVSKGLGDKLGVNVDGRFFDRQAFVGLATPFGAILAGRQYTPAYETFGMFDIMNTQSSLSAGQVGALPASVDIRYNNAVSYRLQKSGFTATLMAAPGERSADTGRLLGGQAVYAHPAFSVGLGYNTRRNELGEKSLSTAVLGASVKLGPGQLSAIFSSAKDDHPSGLSALNGQLSAALPVSFASKVPLIQNAYVQAFKQDKRLAHIGYKLTLGIHTLYAAYTRLDDKGPSDSDVTSYGAAYSYAFSKRTDANLVFTHVGNKNLAQVAPGQGGFIGGITASPGMSSNSVALGLRHRF